jgi:5-methylcytosine-specific restriction enzyme A
MVQARAEDYRPSKHERYGSQWHGLSQRYRLKHPLCEQCEKEGMTTPATEVHHKIKAKDRPDLILTWTNLMSVCRSCHEKLEREA